MATTTRKAAPSEFDRETHVSRRVLVTIKRDQTTATPRVIWQHELPILEAVFGEGNVVEIDRAALDEGYTARVQPSMLVHNKRQDAPTRPSDAAGLDFVFIGNAQAEFDRMGFVYGRHPEVNQSFVENVYGRMSVGAFKRALGKPTLATLPSEQLRALALAYGFALPVTSKDSSESDKKAAADAYATFYGLPHAALVKLAEECGVEIEV